MTSVTGNLKCVSHSGQIHGKYFDLQDIKSTLLISRTPKGKTHNKHPVMYKGIKISPCY